MSKYRLMENTIYIKKNIFIQNYLNCLIRMEAVTMSDQKEKVATTVVTKREVIKSLADEFQMTIKSVNSIYSSLENKIKMMLANADEKTNVEIHLFDGIKIESKFLPSKVRINNLTGETQRVDKRIKAKASLSRRYLEKLNRKERIT